MPCPIYLDHAATTPVRPEVVDAMAPYFSARFGNPSSAHRWGREARTALDDARARLAGCLGASADEVVFTGGGTEGDNLAVLGGWRRGRLAGRTAVVTSAIEHKAVLEAVHALAEEGGEARVVAVTPAGTIDRDAFNDALDARVAVCSIMWVNNEIGSVQPVPELAALASTRGVFFHTDAVQAFGKVPIDARRQRFDCLTISGHKIGAPKGVGALYLRRGSKLQPLLHGGSQERGRRPGTENVAMAVGLACAAELATEERESTGARLTRLRDTLERAIIARVPDAVIHARAAERAPHILNVSVPGVDAESLLMALDLAGIACSGGSACQTGSDDPSHVITALGVPRDLAASAIRMSLGALTTTSCVERAAEVLTSLVAKARRVSGVSA
ncbi:MAG: cysteine desulfurase NifS [Gemmatimonadaceae bacterium]